MASQAPDIFDGVSIADVIHDVFVEFFSNKDQLGWNPALGGDSDDVDQSFRSDVDQSGAKRRRALSV
jgi:hypothetical protein